MDKDDFMAWSLSQMNEDERYFIEKLEADLQDDLDEPIALIGCIIPDLAF